MNLGTGLTETDGSISTVSIGKINCAIQALLYTSSKEEIKLKVLPAYNSKNRAHQNTRCTIVAGAARRLLPFLSSYFANINNQQLISKKKKQSTILASYRANS